MSRLLVTNKSFELLEPYEGKLSRTVLRGESSRKGADLLDIKIFFGNKVCPYHFLDNRALILQNTILYYSLCIHWISSFEVSCNSQRFTKHAKLCWSISLRGINPSTVGVAQHFSISKKSLM